MPSNRTVVAIKVHFTLITPDKLRRVIFGMEKKNEGDLVHWIINFQLFEREKKADAFGDAIIDLDIELDTALNDKAQKVSDQGLTEKQENHLLGPASDDQVAAQNGEIEQSEADQTVQNTFKKR